LRDFPFNIGLTSDNRLAILSSYIFKDCPFDVAYSKPAADYLKWGLLHLPEAVDLRVIEEFEADRLSTLVTNLIVKLDSDVSMHYLMTEEYAKWPNAPMAEMRKAQDAFLFLPCVLISDSGKSAIKDLFDPEKGRFLEIMGHQTPPYTYLPDSWYTPEERTAVRLAKELGVFWCYQPSETDLPYFATTQGLGAEVLATPEAIKNGLHCVSGKCEESGDPNTYCNPSWPCT
jgi:hypothetical protein